MQNLLSDLNPKFVSSRQGFVEELDIEANGYDLANGPGGHSALGEGYARQSGFIPLEEMSDGSVDIHGHIVETPAAWELEEMEDLDWLELSPAEELVTKYANRSNESTSVGNSEGEEDENVHPLEGEPIFESSRKGALPDLHREGYYDLTEKRALSGSHGRHGRKPRKQSHMERTVWDRDLFLAFHEHLAVRVDILKTLDRSWAR